MAAIDTLTNKLIATSPIGQAPQAITYVPNAVPKGDGTQGLQQLGVAGQTAHLLLGAASDIAPPMAPPMAPPAVPPPFSSSFRRKSTSELTFSRRSRSWVT